MTINLSIPKEFSDLKPRITVVGVGGAGGNAVNNMIRANLVGCEFIACNTDAQALQHSLADRRIQLGQGVTRGLGAGSRPEVGRAAAEEVIEEIMQHLQGSHMVFITAGMGGGTGTGAAPVIARAARETGILTVGVITKPFHFEGTHRMRLADSGIEELTKFVDTLLIIPNQNLFRVANERTTFADAFKMADDVLHSGVRGVTDLMVMPGLINLDFADIRAVMGEMGKAMMGTGEAAGDKRALDAAEAAISNPLLDDVSMKGARGVLINITGGPDMTLFEVDEAANRIREEVDPEANIIFGSTFDEKLEGKIRISVVATGIDAEVSAQARAAADRAQQAMLTLVETPAVTPISAAAAASEPAPLPNFINPRPIPPVHVVADAGRMGQTRAPEPGTPSLSGTYAHVPAFTGQQSGQQPAPQGQAATAETRKVSAEVQNGTFIPPRPMTAAGRSTSGIAEPEPYASLRSGTQTPQPAKSHSGTPSLLSRIIGAGRGSAASRSAPPPPAQQPPAIAPAARAAAAAGHARIEPGLTTAAPNGEDSYLEIPAFLRRQAN